MGKYISVLFVIFGFALVNGQVVGKTTTENYQAEFERQASLYSIPEYFGDPVPVALLDVGLTDDILLQYPELGDYRVGLGLTNITVAFLDETFRFEFVETKDEIKDRMIVQFKASQKGFTAKDRKIALFALIGTHVQLLVGLVLYFFISCLNEITRIMILPSVLDKNSN